MSNQAFVFVCLAGVFGLIAIVGSLLTTWLFYAGALKAWTPRAALAKANGAPIPRKPRPTAFVIFLVVVILALIAAAAVPLATISVQVKLPGRKPVTYGAPLPTPPATPPATTPAPATPAAPPTSDAPK